MVATHKALILTVIFFLLSTGLEVSGYTNLPLAIVLWGVAGVCLIWWLWRFLPENPFQRKFMGPLALIVLGSLCIVAGAAWYFVVAERPSSSPLVEQATIPKTYSIEELRELSGVLGVGVLRETQQEAGTYVKLKMSGALYDFIESNNVTSITDNGTGDISINFAVPLNPENMIVEVKTGEGSIDYKVVEKSADGVRLQFHAYEPSVVRIEIED